MCFSKIIPLLVISIDINKVSNTFKQRVLENKRDIDELIFNKEITPYKIEVPINVVLRDYQLKGIQWIAFMCKYSCNGVLADDMGLGKTIQVLTYIANEIYKYKKVKGVNDKGMVEDMVEGNDTKVGMVKDMVKDMVEGVNESKEGNVKGVKDKGSKQQGVNNSSSNIKGVNKPSDIQHPLSNTPDKQHPLSNTIGNLNGVIKKTKIKPVKSKNTKQKGSNPISSNTSSISSNVNPIDSNIVVSSSNTSSTTSSTITNTITTTNPNPNPNTITTNTITTTNNTTTNNNYKVLVICPSSLTGHWLSEVNNIFPTLTASLYSKGDSRDSNKGDSKLSGSSKDKDSNKVSKDKDNKDNRNPTTTNPTNNHTNNNPTNNPTTTITTTPSDITILSYDAYRNDYLNISKTTFYFIILDEGHLLRNRDTVIYKRILLLKSIYKIILTGTPIQNTIEDIFSLFNILMPCYLGTEKEFNNKFKNINYKEKSEEEYFKMEKCIEELHKKILPFVLRRMKSDVLKDLPPKVIRDIVIEMSEYQREVYRGIEMGDLEGDMGEGDRLEMGEGDSELEGDSYSVDDYRGVINSVDDYRGDSYSIDKQQGVSNKSTKEEGVINSVDDYRGDSNKSTKEEGVINSIDKQQGVNICSNEQQGVNNLSNKQGVNTYTTTNTYTTNAKQTNTSKKLKLSYSSVDKKSNTFLKLSKLLKVCSHLSLIGINTSYTNSCKMKALEDLLNLCGNTDMRNKVLIFCQLRNTIDLIIKDLLLINYKNMYCRLDGSVNIKDRNKTVEEFNKGSKSIMLLTTSVGGLGLNLTSADTVIFYEHDWNPFNDLQAMDRAHRIGQKKTVNVFRLVVKDTVEERVMNLQAFKIHVAGSLISQQNTDIERMETCGLLERFG
ncbi:SNF2-like chromatin remodeling complex protein, partial [Hamiltosporidium magnivora]